MPWGRMDDRLAMSVKIRGLVEPGARGLRAKKQRAEALGIWAQILSWVWGERNDGFVTQDILDLHGWPEANARLLRARFGRAPLIHTPDDGEGCECMAGRGWVADYDYLIHDYLDFSPSRSESDVHRAKQRELRNPALKHAVRVRDGDVCRYCGKICNHSDRRSDDGLTYDHVDPAIAAGAENLVVACRGCNRIKARRTPDQARMLLLPLSRSVTGSATVSEPVTDPDSERFQNRTQIGAQVCLLIHAQTTERINGGRSPGRDGTGPAVGRAQVGPADTPRPPRMGGNPYLRELPEWPPTNPRYEQRGRPPPWPTPQDS
jgi:hypothetical protein